MKKRLLSLILVIALVLLPALSGCADLKPEDTGTNPAPAESVKPAATDGEASRAGTTDAAEPQTEPEGGDETQPDRPGEDPTQPADTGSEQPAIVTDLFDFDRSFASYIETRVSGNYVVSPLSFKYAIGMVMAGTSGSTLSEFFAGLGIRSSEGLEEHLKQFNSFVEGFTAKNQGSNELSALRLANSVWKNEACEDFLGEFKLHMEMYDAELRSFRPANLVKEANAWSNEKTNGLIPKILSDGYDASAAAVLLMNAIYFKDIWTIAFDPAGERSFTTASGATVMKKFMTETANYRYYKDDKTQLVIVPMRDGIEVVFAIGDVSEIEAKAEKAEKRLVKILLPETDIETSLTDGELSDYLKLCGVNEVFTKSADFSRMFANQKVCVDDIIQKAKFTMDRAGIEAAAVTAVIVKATASMDPGPEYVEFNADVPFRFYVRTAKNDWSREGIVLFEGRVSE